MNTDQRSAGRLDASSDLASLRPLHDQVLVKPEPANEQEASAIWLPSSDESKAWRVVSVGSDVTDVAAGDRVLLGPDPGWELPDGHRMLRIGAVLAVLS